MIEAVRPNNQEAWARLNAKLWNDNPEDYLDQLRAGRLPFEYVYREGDTYAGFISLSVRRDYVEGVEGDKPVAYIEGIYVLPEYRNQGVGTALVAFARQWAREQGYRQLASDCEVENQSSRAFHKKMGFAEVATVIHFLQDLDIQGED